MPYTRAHNIISEMYPSFLLATFFLPLARLFFGGATFFHWRDFFLPDATFFRWRDFFFYWRDFFFADATFLLFLLCSPLLDLLRAQTMNTCSWLLTRLTTIWTR